jgi:hypothetical protein
MKARGRDGVIKLLAMNERQQAHIDYFLERLEYWKERKRDKTATRMLAARNADHMHPLCSEEEGPEVFDYLRRLEQERLKGTTGAPTCLNEVLKVA